MAATIALFGITLFLALVALARWKRRRDLVRERMNSKLRGYVAFENAVQPGEPDRASQNEQSLIKVA